MRSRARDTGTDVEEAVRAVSSRTGLDLTGCHRARMVATVRDWLIHPGGSAGEGSGTLVPDDTTQWDGLVDSLTVGETYFFRDPQQLELVRSVVHAAVQQGRCPAQIWSAGCATGEEPYSVAILLGQHALLDRCRVLGTDLSRRAVERATAATYSSWSLRRCTYQQRAAYFDQRGGRFRLKQRYVDAVELRSGNLIAGPPRVAAFDVVLCRNVLIYLSADALPAAAATLRDALRPGGWLVLGPSDPFPATSGLEQVRTPHGVAYRRIGAGAPDGRPRRPSGSETEARRPLPAQALVSPEPPVDPLGGDGAARIEATIRARAARGDRLGAERLLEQALASEPLDAALRCLAATLHLEAGRPEAAVAAARTAVYLDGTLAVAHLLLGRAEQRCGNVDRARRSFRNACEALSALPPDAEVPLAEGRRAGPLAAAAAAMASG